MNWETISRTTSAEYKTAFIYILRKSGDELKGDWRVVMNNRHKRYNKIVEEFELKSTGVSLQDIKEQIEKNIEDIYCAFLLEDSGVLV